MAPSKGDELGRILDYAAHRGALSTSDVAESLGITTSQAYYLLKKLADQWFLTRSGRGLATRYRLAKTRE